jgi:uncharacterized membrane protein
MKATKPTVALAAATPAKIPKAVDEIITSRCSMCHASEPVWSGIASPPKGVMLDTHAQISRQADAIRVHAVMTNAMPRTTSHR